MSFKENCPDLRNSRVIDIINHLNEYKCRLFVTDAIASYQEAHRLYGISLVDEKDVKSFDAVILAVGHNQYKKISKKRWSTLLRKDGVVIDVKSLYSKKFFLI